jgi:tetratricopeptide (TPR) repeat protein
MAIIESLHGRAEVGRRHAEHALAVAERLGLARPARALGVRGLARCVLGDRGGLEDFRSAIVLATDAGQGREAALLYNNLATALSLYEGPVAALEVYRAGIEFAQARGLTEMTDSMTASTMEVLWDSGEHDQALTLAAELAGGFESSDAWGLMVVRLVQVGILTLRGQAAEAVPSLDWIAIASRRLTNLEMIIRSLLTAAAARAALGQHDDAAALLSQLDTTPDSRESPSYAAYLPTMVRTALTIAHPQLAHQLATGLQPRHPIAEHALVTAHASLAEARGELDTAAAGYRDAARRWQQFGTTPEHAHALLGHGRCLTALGQPAPATQALQHARSIFQTLHAAPALAETDTLLQQGDALTA